MSTQTFTIRRKLPSLNEVIDANRANPRAGAALKRETQAAIGWFAKAARLTPQPCPVVVSIDWYEENRRRDPDNVFSAVKFILDALVACEVLPDDGQAEIAGIDSRLHVDKDDPRVVVSLRPVEGG